MLRPAMSKHAKHVGGKAGDKAEKTAKGAPEAAAEEAGTAAEEASAGKAAATAAEEAAGGAEAGAPETPEAAPEAAAEGAEDAPEAVQDQLLRLQADFANYRKRMDRERHEWAVYAAEQLLKELLPVVDNFDRGLESCQADASVKEGFALVRQQLVGAMEKAGAKAIEDPTGQAFNPHLHEAIAQVPSADVPEGCVVAQTQRGYVLADRLLRPAQVVVSAGPAK